MKFIAITSETTLCECCGRTNLNRVVVLRKDSGEYVRYGTTCASKALGKKIAVSFDSATEVLQYAQKWSAKYNLDIVVKGINEKLGYNAKLENNQIYIYLDEWVHISL